ncbi:MAG TPA: 30S ribosome-binding factor RbfA [Candidatus Ozemobacteraceae bacterium]|nr:30S ribosome-binding factor RbfA [Candidatus Ozemobacteraceae bacterium]
MTSHRLERVESTILRELSIILQRRINDPRVRGVHFVAVDISPDFHLARVSFSLLEESLDPEAAQRGLDSAKPVLRGELKKAVQLRKIPELAFRYDPSIREGDHILDLLRRIEPAKAPPPPDQKPDADS